MFEILDEKCKPTKGSEFAACIDLRSREDITITAGESKLIPLGIKIDKKKMPIYLQNNLHRHYLQLMLRSSLSKELIIANGVGIIDLDYEDEIMIRVHLPLNYGIAFEIDGIPVPNESDKFEIKKGQRVAQITLLEHKAYLFDVETENKRTGGFGSTGK